MTKVGIIARQDFTGLGIQSKEFFDHIPCKALVIDSTKLNGTQQNPHWYPDQATVKIDTWLKIKREILDDFLDGLDVVVTFETPYDYSLFDLCRTRKIRSVLQLNYEFLDYPSTKHPPPDMFAAPSMWNYDRIPSPKMFLQVPVDTEKFKPQRKEKTFLHVAGRHAIYDRNGTTTFLDSLQYVKNKINVILAGQNWFAHPKMPHNVNLSVAFNNIENYWENYTGGVLVMPRKYGGLCLPMQEAIGAEMPVIATDISPNNQWLPKEWLVPASQTGSFKCKNHVDVFDANPRQLAAKIDQFCDAEFYDAAVVKAQEIKEKISWEKQLPVYKKFLGI